MKLRIMDIVHREIIHYASRDLSISSLYNKIFVTRQGQEFVLRLPDHGWRRILGFSRLARRALRLDKCNVVPVGSDLVIIRGGWVYHYFGRTGRLAKTLHLKHCQNVLHQSILAVDSDMIVFGEYGNNRGRGSVAIYRSVDGGVTWHTIFEFPAGKIRHVHGCYWDPYEERIWVFTGDMRNECHVVCADKDFRNVEWIGDGHQTYRACAGFFEADAVHWIMDSQMEDCFHIRLDRATRAVAIMAGFPGPVWYTKRLTDGYYLAATTQERGVSVIDKCAHLFVSGDLHSWEDVRQFRHDGLPKKYFKAGVVAFAEGPQSSDGFYIFGEALRGLDGKAALCKLEF